MNGPSRSGKAVLVGSACTFTLAVVASCLGGSRNARPSWERELPASHYDHPPKKTFERNAYAFEFDQLEEYYRVPGEFGHRMIGENYGFDALSLIVTDTYPGGGPRLHSHDVEEAHVLLEGSATYVIGDRTFTVQAPYVARVPAGVPHAFINAGSKPMNLVAVFPSKKPEFKILGPNPLIPAK